MSGIVIWYYFSACLSRTSTTFAANSALFTKVYFPRLTIPIAECISNIWQFLIQLSIFLGFYLFFWRREPPSIPATASSLFHFWSCKPRFSDSGLDASYLRSARDSAICRWLSHR